MISKRYAIPMAAIALIGATALGVTAAQAASDDTNPQSPLVQKIADKFHLDKTKVQAVFDEDRQSHQATMEAKYEERLAQAVTDGKLTADQKTKVLAEHKQLQSEMDAQMKQVQDD